MKHPHNKGKPVVRNKSKPGNSHGHKRSANMRNQELFYKRLGLILRTLQAILKELKDSGQKSRHLASVKWHISSPEAEIH